MKDSETPSTTALAIALLILILGGDEYGRQRLSPGCLESQIQLLKSCGLPFGRYPKLISNPIISKLVRWFICIFFSPHLLEGVGFRKLYMEKQVRNAIVANGIRQVLVVAGGYDTLALRLSTEFANVNFWEVDHPATARVKKRGISRNNAVPPNLFLVSADLSQCTLKHALTEWNNNNSNNKDAIYETSAPTVVIIEGLLMYLTEAQVKSLFADVATVVGKESLVCFDYLAWNHDNDRVDMKNSSFVHALVRLKGEPWYWGMACERLPSFFQDDSVCNCWTVTDQQQRVGIENVACVKLNTST